MKINIQPAEQISTNGYFSSVPTGKTCTIEQVPACDETTNPIKTITIPSYFYASGRYIKVTSLDGDGVGMPNTYGYTKFIFSNGIKSIIDTVFISIIVFDLIKLPSSLESIGDRAFWMCSNLTSITIPSSVTSIDYQAFWMCSNLTIITFQGTKAQWNAITFGDYWDLHTGEYTIRCTDGDIAKS